MKNLIVYIMLLTLFVSEFSYAAEIPSHKITENNIFRAKKEAIQDANKSIFEDNNTLREDDLVTGEIKENSKSKSVKGYINETVILSLDDCIKKALENNPQIRSAYNNTLIYKSQIGQAWSKYFPTFDMTNGYTKNRFLSLNFSVPQTVYSYYNTVTINGTQLIFDFGKTKAAADMAKKSYESTLANFDEMVNSTIFNVKSAYYKVLYALEEENVYIDSVKNYELQLKRANAFYQIGTKSKIDVIMAQYNLGNAQLGLIKAQNNIELATAELNNAMGLPDKNNYKILDKLEVKEYPYTFEEIVQIAYNKRPELIAYEKKAKASEILIRSTKRAYYPDFEAIGMYQVGGGARFSDDYGWKIGAQFKYGSTNIMMLKKLTEEAKATHQKDLADLEAKKQNIYLEVKQAYINVKNANESIPITALSLKQAQEQYRLADGRYKAGIGDAVELKDSENTYRNARLDYLSALLQYNVSIADLERVIGCKLKDNHFEE